MTNGDMFTHEIIRGYLLSTVAELVEAIRRSAYSPVVSQALDFTCGLFDKNGRRLVAQGAGLPIHAGTLTGAMELVLGRFPRLGPGDVVVHNDPYRGGAHQADVAVAAPLYWGTELLGYAINRAHWVDIGQAVPGGWSGTSQHVVEEGLMIPTVKLFEGGVLDEQVRDFILSNVRTPQYVWGDLMAQVASCRVAVRRLGTLADRYGVSTLEEAQNFSLEYSKKRFLAALERIPDGSWYGEDFFEDTALSNDRKYVRCNLTKHGAGLIADFSESDDQVFTPINNSIINMRAGTYVAALTLIDPEVPLNSGFLDLIEVIGREGTITHATWPAPVFMATADPTIKAYEVVMRALSQAVPERGVGGSYQTGNNTTGAGMDDGSGHQFQWYLFGAGGCGARYTIDGLSAEWHPMANVKNQSLEMLEHSAPLEFQEFSLIQDSGGAGRTRGGLGYRRRMKLLVDTQVSAAADRHVVGAWGIEGGERGRPNRFAVRRQGLEYRMTDIFDVVSPSKFQRLPLSADDEYIVESGGGGGWGDPLDREAELVAADVLHGYVSEVEALDRYGVVLGQDGSVARAETEARRNQLRRSFSAPVETMEETR